MLRQSLPEVPAWMRALLQISLGMFPNTHLSGTSNSRGQLAIWQPLRGSHVEGSIGRKLVAASTTKCEEMSLMRSA